MADSETIRKDFAAIEKNITALLTTANTTMTTLKEDNSEDLVEEVAALGTTFLGTITELQKLFDTQVTRLEEERTAQPPSSAMYGHEMDALLALQATDIARGHVDGLLNGKNGAASGDGGSTSDAMQQ